MFAIRRESRFENKAPKIEELDKISEIAFNELREDEFTRKQCLGQFKEWIVGHPDIENCLMDDRFLIRFLRVKKFSMPMAQQMLLKYLNLRKKYKHIFYDMDCLDSKVCELITNGYIFVSPFRDHHGRRVILTLPGKLDPYRFTSTDMARAHMICYETLLEDEENQILGFTHFGDGADVTISHVSIWSITEFATLMKWGEQSCPIRHKVCHVVNLMPAFKYVVEFAAGRVSDKLRRRLKIHSSVSDLHASLSPSVLPKEYGGVMPMAEMIELWKDEMLRKRERLLSFDCMNLTSDQAIIRRRTKFDEEADGLQGSFRKLEVD